MNPNERTHFQYPTQKHSDLTLASLRPFDLAQGMLCGSHVFSDFPFNPKLQICLASSMPASRGGVQLESIGITSRTLGDFSSGIAGTSCAIVATDFLAGA
jgi:hypothetical protein